jgi:pimeloyl-ACP methyl ester carboxylesterase
MVALYGADDGVTPGPSSATLAISQPGSSARVIPGAGHNLPQETPAAVVQAVRELLGR